MLMFGLAQSSQFGLWDYIPPPPSPSLLFTYIIQNMRTQLRAKGLVGTRGGGNDV